MLADWLYYVFGTILLLANLAAWSGNLCRLPGNWIIAANSTLFLSFFPEKENGLGLSWFTVCMLFMLAALGDSIGYAMKRHHFMPAKSQRPVGGILAGAGIGSLFGGMVGLVIPVVGTLIAILGSVGGAAGGAYLGTLITDLRHPPQAGSTADSQKDHFLGLTPDQLKLVPRLLIGGLMVVMGMFATFAG